MNRTILLVIFGFCMVVAWQVVADDDDRIEMFKENSKLSRIANPLYIKECGSCHMAYFPQLLPSRSWRQMMAGLADHFGDNAELEKNAAAEIERFLVTNGADKSDSKLARKFVRKMKRGETPLRITELKYFRHEHNEIPKSVLQKAKLNSLSQCEACHRRADKGSFKEREIDIPGTGAWDD